MKRHTPFLILGLMAATPPLIAQDAHSTWRADVSTLDAIIEAYYDIVSGPAGEVADRARDKFIHRPDALVAITGVNQDGEGVISTMTIDEYHDRAGGPRREPFYEYELHRLVQRFGNVAHVWSTYASSRTPGGEPYARGINSIQLYFDGDRWWVTNWIFDSERSGNPIPAEYLP